MRCSNELDSYIFVLWSYVQPCGDGGPDHYKLLGLLLAYRKYCEV